MQIIPFTPKDGPDYFMVLLDTMSFPEGKSFRNVPTIEDATELRRAVQTGQVPVTHQRRAYSLDLTGKMRYVV